MSSDEFAEPTEGEIMMTEADTNGHVSSEGLEVELSENQESQEVLLQGNGEAS